jgi:amino acid permease
MLSAIALAISTTIGAGVLGLPKALYLMGPWGVAAGLLVAFFLILSAMMLSDMLQREKKPIQLPALISSILGDRWKYFVYMTLIFSMYGALAAYLLGFGSQLNAVAGTPELYGGLLLFAVTSYLVYRGTRVIEKVDLPLAAALVLFLLALSAVNVTHFAGFEFDSPGMAGVLTFTGTMLFALFGLNVIPEINFLSRGRVALVFTVSTLLSLLLYLGFAFTTVGVLGDQTTDLGTTGLALFYGGTYNVLISLFTVTALFTSFLGIGLGMRHIYQFDFGLSRVASTLAVALPPFALFLCSDRLGIGFLDILGLAGELTLPLFTITVSYAYLKVLPAIKPKTPFPRASALATGAFYSIIFFFSVAQLIL